MEASPFALFVGGVLTTVILGVINGLRRQGNALNGMKSSTKETIGNLNARIADLEDERDKAKLETQELKTQVGILERQVEELTDANRAAQSSIQQFRDENNKLLREKSELMGQKADSHGLIAQQEREISELKRRVQDLEHQLAVRQSVDAIVSGLTGKIETAFSTALDKWSARFVPETGNS